MNINNNMQHNSWGKDRNLLSEAYTQIREGKESKDKKEDKKVKTPRRDQSWDGPLKPKIPLPKSFRIHSSEHRGKTFPPEDAEGASWMDDLEGNYMTGHAELPALKKGQRVYVVFNDGGELEGKIDFDGTDIGNSNAFTLDGKEYDIDEVVSIDPLEGEESDPDLEYFKAYDELPESQDDLDRFKSSRV